MRRFSKTFDIGHKHIKLYFAEYDDRKDVCPAMCSGIAFEQPQYLFLDYDTEKPMKEGWHIVEEYELHRGLVVESSPNRYWFISFSPMNIADICEIMFFSSADKKHCAHMMWDGFVAIRLKEKVEGYPRIHYEMINQKGTNFYDYDRERAFREFFGMPPFRNIPLAKHMRFKRRR